MNVVTWNMQGSTGQGESKWVADVRRLFNEANADVALLQEAGTPPPTARRLADHPQFITAEPPALGFPTWGYYEWNMGTSGRANIVKIYWVLSDPGANRNNMALAFRIDPTNLMIVPNPRLDPGRPALGARFLNGIQELDLYTVHASATGGGDAPAFLDAINATGTADWAAGGDFNRAPGTVENLVPYVLCPHRSVATHPGTGTNLDYMFKNFQPRVVGNADEQFVVSDHFPVGYVL